MKQSKDIFNQAINILKKTNGDDTTYDSCQTYRRLQNRLKEFAPIVCKKKYSSKKSLDNNFLLLPVLKITSIQSH